MLVKHEFKIDQFVIKNAPNPAKRLESFKAYEAQRLGMKIVELFPFVKDEKESFNGELPEMSLNRDHEYTDLYRAELSIIKRETLTEAIRTLNKAIGFTTYAPAEALIKQAIKLLTDEHIPCNTDSTNPAIPGSNDGR